MYYLIFISIALSLYALYVARNVSLRLESSPRSFHFTLSKVGESKDIKIKFYVLYLSGTRVFFDQETYENINISRKIDTSIEITKDKLIKCFSWGDSLRLQYIINGDSERAEQGEELSLNLLSLPKSSESTKSIENQLKQDGWEMKRALSTDDLCFIKENLEIYLTYIS